jgi:hypothetical protein
MLLAIAALHTSVPSRNKHNTRSPSRCRFRNRSSALPHALSLKLLPALCPFNHAVKYSPVAPSHSPHVRSTFIQSYIVASAPNNPNTASHSSAGNKSSICTIRAKVKLGSLSRRAVSCREKGPSYTPYLSTHLHSLTPRWSPYPSVSVTSYQISSPLGGAIIHQTSVKSRKQRELLHMRQAATVGILYRHKDSISSKLYKLPTM